MTTSSHAAEHIVFRKGFKIGEPAAEADTDFLTSCFINNGIVAVATDVHMKQCVLLGRTGSGKSAIIQHIIETQDNVIPINPENLALANISNSSVLNFFEAAGVHMDSFYKLLWKHIFTTELIKVKYNINNGNDLSRFRQLLSGFGRVDNTKKAALDYLNQWGDRFWIDEEHRTTQLTQKLERNLELNIGADIYGKAKLGAKGLRDLTEEEKQDVVQHGQTAIVDRSQMASLDNVVKVLSENVFNDRNNVWYIGIDSLDDDWADDKIRFKLIKALFETIKSLRSMVNVKIIITMRVDLIESLFDSISSPGFQSEKFSGYFLPMKWTKKELTDLLSKRVDYLFEHRYTNKTVHINDVIARKVNGKPSGIDYILDRTFLRPREAISFFNKCMEMAEGQSYITEEDIKRAEYNYSSERVVALCEEWSRQYPYLRDFLDFLRKMKDGVEVAHLITPKFENFCETFFEKSQEINYPFSEEAENAFLDMQKYGLTFMRSILSVLYKVGVVGLKLSPEDRRVFSFSENVRIEKHHIERTTRVYVHKAFWVALSIRSSEQ